MWYAATTGRAAYRYRVAAADVAVTVAVVVVVSAVAACPDEDRAESSTTLRTISSDVPLNNDGDNNDIIIYARTHCPAASGVNYNVVVVVVVADSRTTTTTTS